MVDRLEEIRVRRDATPPTDRGEQTRRSILDAAAQAFSEGGYAGTSLNDVITRAGVTKGGFYFHFASKEALALTVLRTKQEQWAGKVLAAAMKHPRAIDQLEAVPRAVCDLYEQDPSATAIGRLCMELAENRSLVPQLAPQFTTWIDLTTSLVRKAQDEGSIRTDIDAALAGEAAVSAFFGAELMSSLISQSSDLRERVERFITFFRTAMTPPPS
jgi:AcrR family transcriptional regulator